MTVVSFRPQIAAVGDALLAMLGIASDRNTDPVPGSANPMEPPAPGCPKDAGVSMAPDAADTWNPRPQCTGVPMTLSGLSSLWRSVAAATVFETAAPWWKVRPA